MINILIKERSGMTNNEMKQSLIDQVSKQVPELKLDAELYAAFLILLHKALDAFEDGLKQSGRLVD